MTTPALPAFVSGRRLPNLWDLAAILCVLAGLVLVAHAAGGTLAPLPAANTIHLGLAYLPYYALRTTLRMFVALIFSIVFTLVVAPLAAKSRRLGVILIPALDILQSVPILGFLSFTVLFFLNLFPGRVLGAELAAVFAIFTSQAWNMTFSFYQSLTTVPRDLDEASRSFRLSIWQRFWRLEVPFAMPGLVFNTMLSMSGGWFFVVASEAVTVGNTTFLLPGIGSYVSVALSHSDLAAVIYAIIAMLVVILIYDQLLFRPLVAWSAKFRFEMTSGGEAPDPWVLSVLRRTRLLQLVGDAIGDIANRVGGLRMRLPLPVLTTKSQKPSRVVDGIWFTLVGVVVAFAFWRVAEFVAASVTLSGLAHVVLLGFYTLLRVAAAMIICTIVWVPIGVWIGLRPRWARLIQPIAQFLAAFPANLLFPIVVIVLVRFALNPNIWLTPLMIVGTQWYVLFNVVAGASAFPGDLKEASANLGIKGLLWWRRVIIPGIFPYYITGALTASGAAWNSSIVAEVASWGHTTLTASGLGSYIAQATTEGNTSHIVLGVFVMTAFVLTINRILWRPLHAFAVRRLTF
ncbi:ABC transporter permease subunit [Acidisoma cellulosilytica]|uniref:ABC transporter permease subunit n=1 Tax=Acidisoma cellulosilyticum TaxID=2802395 RepID=A0A963YYS0_9PROT|nr:ABC transporter permease subunit [Acidisoma cellulosilyticum]MCB8878817.1 ABC transporter permease subunit [Acidisoma cellulosilyticum]